MFKNKAQELQIEALGYRLDRLERRLEFYRNGFTRLQKQAEVMHTKVCTLESVLKVQGWEHIYTPAKTEWVYNSV